METDLSTDWEYGGFKWPQQEFLFFNDTQITPDGFLKTD